MIISLKYLKILKKHPKSDQEVLLTDQEASEIEVLLRSWNKSCNLNNLNKETPQSSKLDCGVNIVFSDEYVLFFVN